MLRSLKNSCNSQVHKLSGAFSLSLSLLPPLYIHEDEEVKIFPPNIFLLIANNLIGFFKNGIIS